MLFDYKSLTPIEGVKRTVRQNQSTGYMLVTYERGVRKLTIERIKDCVYHVEKTIYDEKHNYVLMNLDTVDMVCAMFFGK